MKTVVAEKLKKLISEEAEFLTAVVTDAFGVALQGLGNSGGGGGHCPQFKSGMGGGALPSNFRRIIYSHFIIVSAYIKIF